MESKYDSLALKNQLSFPLYLCSKEIIRKYTPMLEKLDLTYTQYIVMMYLWERKTSNVKDISQILLLDSGTLTPLLKKLEANTCSNLNWLMLLNDKINIPKDLYNFRLEAPFIPPNADNFDHKYCNEVENQGLKTRERFEEIKLKDNYKTIFKDYLYFNRYELSSHDNKSIYINIHESMYKDRGDNNEQRINNINENYMSLRFMHYRNSSINI